MKTEQTYDYRDIDNSSWIADLYNHSPETRFPDIDPTSMSADDVSTLAAYLRDDDGSLSEEDMEFSRGVADEVEDWQEEVITEHEDRIAAARKWAEENGYDRFRIGVFDDGANPLKMFKRCVR